MCEQDLELLVLLKLSVGYLLFQRWSEKKRLGDLRTIEAKKVTTKLNALDSTLTGENISPHYHVLVLCSSFYET